MISMIHILHFDINAGHTSISKLFFLPKESFSFIPLAKNIRIGDLSIQKTWDRFIFNTSRKVWSSTLVPLRASLTLD